MGLLFQAFLSPTRSFAPAGASLHSDPASPDQVAAPPEYPRNPGVISIIAFNRSLTAPSPFLNRLSPKGIPALNKKVRQATAGQDLLARQPSMSTTLVIG
jgi:hypothetical protein